MAAAAIVQTCTPDAAFERPRKLFLELGGSGSHPQSEEEIKDRGKITVVLHMDTVWHKYTNTNT